MPAGKQVAKTRCAKRDALGDYPGSRLNRRIVKAALIEGPEAHGYSTGLWTIGRVAVLIQEITGIHYHKGHVWKILRGLGWSSQRPVGRALERNEQAIADWKNKQWPAIKKKR